MNRETAPRPGADKWRVFYKIWLKENSQPSIIEGLGFDAESEAAETAASDSAVFNSAMTSKKPYTVKVETDKGVFSVRSIEIAAIHVYYRRINS